MPGPKYSVNVRFALEGWLLVGADGKVPRHCEGKEDGQMEGMA